MSHHLDSPIARQDVRLDITDLYCFRGETGTVFLINVCHSIAGDIPVPGYHPEGKYEFKIDLDGDAVEDLTYRFQFDERDAGGKQRFTLRRISGPEAADTHASGTIIAQGSTNEIIKDASGFRIWAGKAYDPFWIEPDVLHAVGHAFQDGTIIDLSGRDAGKAGNLFAGHSVYSIVLEVPDADLIPDAGQNGRIGVWALTSLATDAGGWRSINRVGLPMIHPLFTQFNEDLGNRLNAGRPRRRFRDPWPDRHRGGCRRRTGQRHRGRSSRLCGESRTPVSPQYPPLYRRHTGRVWLCRLERPLFDGQCAECHVHDRIEHACFARHRQRVGPFEADQGVSVCSDEGGRERDGASRVGEEHSFGFDEVRKFTECAWLESDYLSPGCGR